MSSRPGRGAAAYAAAALLIALATVLLARAWVGSTGPDLASAAELRAIARPSAPAGTTGTARESTGGGADLAPAGGPGAGARTPGRPGPTLDVRPAPPTEDPPRTSPPRALLVPAAEIRMPVDPTGVARDGQMVLPDDVRRVGWYEYGPGPGASGGAAVLAGHVDTQRQGPGPLERLREVAEGDAVSVLLADGSTVGYRVTTVTRIRKEDLDLAAVFDRRGPARLHVLTCGGAFDETTHHYEDNVLVVATPDPTGR